VLACSPITEARAVYWDTPAWSEGAAPVVPRSGRDELWLQEGRKLALRALRPRMLDTPFGLSLYKGAVGPVVLAEELSAPMTASMPLFEQEGWPSAQ
jgi:hypothetical protein